MAPVMERAAYRIVDANFNRAREAIRVVEEYCRFVLNSAVLSERAKQLRHELSTAVGELNAGELLAGRDTLGDVGVGQRVQGQLQRTTLKDCFSAGAKRLTEALRVLSETIQTENKAVAKTLEQLRYTAYTLEKDIALFAEPVEKFNRVRLYAIITSDLPSELLSLASRCSAGGADCLQLRAKAMPDNRRFAVAVEFVEICREMGTLSIINDRADIAIAAGADGVHLGRNDLPVEQARRLQLTPLIVGTSTHNDAELAAACRDLPTYVALGPAFATPTKSTIDVAGLDYIQKGLGALDGTGISHVAIGGITADNVERIIAAGARRIAVCSAVTASSDPAEACRKLKDRIVKLTGETSSPAT